MTRNRKLIILLIFIIGVASSFWLVSRYPALDNKAALSCSEAFEDPLTHEAHFHAPRHANFVTRVAYTTLNWYDTNWRGMAFGLVLAAGFYTLLKYTKTNQVCENLLPVISKFSVKRVASSSL